MHRLILNSLNQWKKHIKRKPLILNGARQVGKTWVLKEFGKQSFKKVHYFNFEQHKHIGTVFDADFNIKRIINELQLISKNKIKYVEDLIVFDEIQECPKAITALKYFAEDLPEAYIACAGSLLGLNLSPTSFPVGKVFKLDMYPMTFFEFLLAMGEENIANYLQENAAQQLPCECKISEAIHLELWNLFKQYLIVGGLPEVVDIFVNTLQSSLLDATEKAREKQKQLISDYLADIAKHCGKVNSMHIERVLKSIPAQMAHSVDSSLPKYVFKEVVANIRGYDRLAPAIDWLTKAGLIIKHPIVNSGEFPFLGHSSENIFKLMLFDVGILGALIELSPQSIISYDYGSFKGYFAENFVAQELYASSNKNIACWREGESEIEFLTVSNLGKVIPVEVKAGNIVKAKSLRSFINRYNPNYSLVLSEKIGKCVANCYYYPLYAAGLLKY